MTSVAVFTVLQLVSPLHFNAKVFLVDVKENDFINADEGDGRDSRDNKDYANYAGTCAGDWNGSVGLLEVLPTNGKCKNPRIGCTNCKRQLKP